MQQPIAIIGAGVSGLSCAVLLAEHGFRTTIFAHETGSQITSAAAGAVWFPYDVEPLDRAIEWALKSYTTFVDLCDTRAVGVSMIELRSYCRAGTIDIPGWARDFGAAAVDASKFGNIFASGFAVRVPLIDTTIYLPYLTDRCIAAGVKIQTGKRLNTFEEIPSEFSVVVNCSGIGARALAPDHELEPHRGQVVITPKLNLEAVMVCDDLPLMYVIPRTNDCVFGGTNEVSDNCNADPKMTAAILAECSRVLGIGPPPVLGEKVGLRPFRRPGVRLEAERLGSRVIIHNYGHGGSGFTLSWGCAEEVLAVITQPR